MHFHLAQHEMELDSEAKLLAPREVRIARFPRGRGNQMAHFFGTGESVIMVVVGDLPLLFVVLFVHVHLQRT